MGGFASWFVFVCGFAIWGGFGVCGCGWFAVVSLGGLICIVDLIVSIGCLVCFVLCFLVVSFGFVLRVDLVGPFVCCCGCAVR